MKNFTFFSQIDSQDCGVACLRMISRYYGKNFSSKTLREKCSVTREGVSLLSISKAAESIGLKSIGIKTNFDELSGALPMIVHWNQEHFVIVYKIKKDTVYVADPGIGLVKYTKQEFLKSWAQTTQNNEYLGICLVLDPTPAFYEVIDEKSKSNLFFLFNYLKPHKKFIIQLFIGLLFGSILQLLFPFLTQAIVDVGIANQDIGFVYLILIAQLTLYLSQTCVEFIRGWIMLHISTRINISLISDFLIKLLKLPLDFFERRTAGDIMQRIGDHSRVQSFLTGSTLNIFFSIFNILIFGLVIAIYSLKILAIFLFGSTVYIIWILFFLKKRKVLDYKMFEQSKDDQNTMLQIVEGIQEIKINNVERQKRWDWETIQARIFKIKTKSLKLSQFESAGAFFINQTTRTLMSFLTAKAVIDGELTLGAMMAISYILGQLNAPIQAMVGLVHAFQNAKISMERIGEIHQSENEEQIESKVENIPNNNTISLKDLSFQYGDDNSEMVLKNLNVNIPAKKTTAIVGASGSGKTTLVKLLLGLYRPVKGNIFVGDSDLSTISNSTWRDNCGVVLQDGYIFADTIANNIIVHSERVNQERLIYAAKMANIAEYIEALPLGFNTKIGHDGQGLSQGQKQRVLIARAIYKDPKFMFFDEATNALDANNESKIVHNLNNFFSGKTVVVVAHRLSTVRNADLIIAMQHGKVQESGTHDELICRKGYYYNLVRNQLELGN